MLKGKINFKVSGRTSKTEMQKVVSNVKEAWEKELLVAKSEIGVEDIISEIKIKSDSSKISGFATAALNLTDTEENRATFNCMMNGLSGWVRENLAAVSILCGSSFAHVEIWCEDLSEGTSIKTRLKNFLGLGR